MVGEREGGRYREGESDKLKEKLESENKDMDRERDCGSRTEGRERDIGDLK